MNIHQTKNNGKTTIPNVLDGDYKVTQLKMANNKTETTRIKKFKTVLCINQHPQSNQ
jgi:hypothetical protein